MPMIKNTEKPEELTPWYVNQTLAQSEIESYEAWLDEHPDAKDELRLWQAINRAVLEQPRFAPHSRVFEQINSHIGEHRTSLKFNWRILPAIASGLAAAMIVFVLLWLIVKPGITMRWSVNGVVPATFRVYRAPTGSPAYELIGEIKSEDNQFVYQYRDLIFVPGRSYLYRVDGINSSGEITFSKAVINDTRSILPGQLIILLTSVIMGYVCLSIINYLPRYLPAPGERVKA
jgi:hypothetical protein